MRAVARLLAIFFIPNLLTSCTSLFFVHDPQSGVISAGQLPGFLKSIRCELVTFYQLELKRKEKYEKYAPLYPKEALEKYAYFEVEKGLYGAFTLELKVTDAASLGSGTVLDYRRIVNSTTSNTTHLGPTASTQGTYDLIWNFLIRQDAKLKSVNYPGDPVERGCYNGDNFDLRELEALADNKAPERTAFDRIFVDGRLPLAGWLRDNGTLISASYLGLPERSAAAEPAQMTYTFSIQVVAGLEAKYTIVTPTLVPAAVQGGGSLQQNSILSFYINGPAAAATNSAKSGSAAIYPLPTLGTVGRPMHVTSDNTNRQIMESAPTPDASGKPPAVTPVPRVREPAARSPFRGYLLNPLPVFPPAPAPMQ
jgi:hypothetical protein